MRNYKALFILFHHTVCEREREEKEREEKEREEEEERERELAERNTES